MSYHASANTYEINGAKSFHAFVEKRISNEQSIRELVGTRGMVLSEMITSDRAWHAFWATIADDASNMTILAAIEAEIKRLNDDAVIADWQDDRQLHAQLKRGG